MTRKPEPRPVTEKKTYTLPQPGPKQPETIGSPIGR